jgi:hypothetical protein
MEIMEAIHNRKRQDGPRARDEEERKCPSYRSWMFSFTGGGRKLFLSQEQFRPLKIKQEQTGGGVLSRPSHSTRRKARQSK